MTEEEWHKAVAWWLLGEAERRQPNPEAGPYRWRPIAARVACLARLGPDLPDPVRRWAAVATTFLDAEDRTAEADGHLYGLGVTQTLTAVYEAAGPELRERFAAAHDVFAASPDGTLGDPWDAAYIAESEAQAALIRDVFGNPFRPVALDPSWRTSAVVGLAQSMYGARAFDRMPILADALEEAGCDHPDVLAHCRGPGPHVRGCWVVDLVLGKQ